mmetsp:Transcript_23286/g.78847  ORF Transcript_23286/g.78847 Transcript_23286/m.78847 type:complete len:235 (-) Transcript_23286:275-979(-)
MRVPGLSSLPAIDDDVTATTWRTCDTPPPPPPPLITLPGRRGGGGGAWLAWMRRKSVATAWGKRKWRRWARAECLHCVEASPGSAARVINNQVAEEDVGEPSRMASTAAAGAGSSSPDASGCGASSASQRGGKCQDSGVTTDDDCGLKPWMPPSVAEVGEEPAHVDDGTLIIFKLLVSPSSSWSPTVAAAQARRRDFRGQCSPSMRASSDSRPSGASSAGRLNAICVACRAKTM